MGKETTNTDMCGNEEFTAIWCNNYFFESTGYTKEEYISIYHYNIRNYFACMSEEYDQIAQTVVEAYRRGDSDFQCVVRMPHKYNNFIWIKVVGTFTSERRDGVPVLYVVYTDVTDVIEQQELRKRLEERSEMLHTALEEAEKANHAKSDFLSRMSHDIRTPLNAIIGMTEIADSNLDDPEKIHDCHRKIALSSQHLLGLINDVLDMSKIESGKMTINREPVSLSELVENVEAIMRPDMESRSQHFLVRFHHITADSIYSDALRLRQVFINILSNASKFTPHGGTITFDIDEMVHEEKEPALLRFLFTDTGIGMRPEFLNQLFEVFAREQDSRVDKTTGSGLGMAITKKIVDMLEGDIQVQSQVGAGTTFQITLPLVLPDQPLEDSDFSGHGICAADTAHQNEPKKKYDFSGRRFLLAEDNDLNREIAVELLSATGAKIACACDGSQCVNMFKQSPEGCYDLILMDIQMPVMDGYTAAKTIRSLSRTDAETVQIWAMTANAFVEDIEMAKSAGMNGHFAKPLDIALINREISRLFP